VGWSPALRLAYGGCAGVDERLVCGPYHGIVASTGAGDVPLAVSTDDDMKRRRGLSPLAIGLIASAAVVLLIVAGICLAMYLRYTKEEEDEHEVKEQAKEGESKNKGKPVTGAIAVIMGNGDGGETESIMLGTDPLHRRDLNVSRNPLLGGSEASPSEGATGTQVGSLTGSPLGNASRQAATLQLSDGDRAGIKEAPGVLSQKESRGHGESTADHGSAGSPSERMKRKSLHVAARGAALSPDAMFLDRRPSRSAASTPTRVRSAMRGSPSGLVSPSGLASPSTNRGLLSSP